ncbi:VIT1/CCC1 transporter family protein [Gordonia sp. (in: high G+C Gram-positive bacteria)]|uniref:VIT1/CCC1 transporter family protein n=1 Tax=Gordonia sp. (in: high G+C Gram-positive bacteria) TaxID=84139 RepID=UPI0025BA67A4|nr:VIT1/CCC1 transporter family protein [Gordonia sp. (in: high G+C Gram-positive bacteria)]HMS77365.1 VIT1/CCC1 transporter family protein [Gordonia sp. (in: high G+C Gram-positive bacteria)]HQV16951.1 VIT1/CCC1 transporter family protein [Gordonia sp. (in: high G+C Gram-positive bacteria)]
MSGSPLARISPDTARSRITDVNDGIMAVAGMSLGLAGAEVSRTTAYAVITISAVVGALSVFGAELGEGFAQREAELATVAEEQRLLELEPEEEIEELVEWFEAKGVSTETSRKVAEELSDADALSAQLEIEYGIRELTSTRDAWAEGFSAGIGFLIGALAPVAIAYLIPFGWREEWTIIAAITSLIVTSFVLASTGGSNIGKTVARSVIMGAGTLAASHFLGDWLI